MSYPLSVTSGKVFFSCTTTLQPLEPRTAECGVNALSSCSTWSPERKINTLLSGHGSDPVNFGRDPLFLILSRWHKFFYVRKTILGSAFVQNREV